MFNLDEFIQKKIIKRESSFFEQDIKANFDKLGEKIQGKSFLVIGGAGTIGSSFIKSILPFKPSSLVVVDINENALTELTRDIRSSGRLYIPKDYVTYPMDFASSVFDKMFRSRGGFDVVGNFSAHKHVRSEKDVYSVEALIRNNILNAVPLLDLLSNFSVEQYFCVSTDKAANPVNIMGASKRIMEDLIFSYADRFPVKTARFANVAFSNGSLLDGFLKRLGRLQPLSAPSDIERYFVSPQESGQICMLACLLGRNMEIFFPKLKSLQMMRFDTIARELLHEFGYETLECGSDEEAIEASESLKFGSKFYPVHFSSSDTSGEKTFEEFFTEDESVRLEKFSSLGVITNKKIPNKEELQLLLLRLSKEFAKEFTTKEEVVSIMRRYLPNFRHKETGKSLDDKM